MSEIFGTVGADTITETTNTAGGTTAGPGADTIYGGANGADSLGGGGGDDVLFSSIGLSTLDGGTGNDTLVGSSGAQDLRGGDGKDSLDGGNGDDTLAGGLDADTLAGGAGNDQLIAGTAASLLLGGAGNDSLTAGAGNDTLDGGDGNDFISMGISDGADSIVGGNGVDSVSYVGAGFVFASLATGIATPGSGAADTLSGIESISGAAGADSLQGSTGNDSLSGEGGNDTLDGGDGDDVLGGGTGNNSIVGGLGLDSIFYNFVGATPILANLVTGIVSRGGEQDTLDGIEGLGGASGADSLEGNDADNHFFGGSGNDTLGGGGGSDTLAGNAGNDSLVGGSGVDVATFASTRAGYTITGLGGGVFTVVGPDGADTVSGIEALRFSDQTIWFAATAGNDSILGTPGTDSINGVDGNDTLDGLGGPDSLLGSAGEDSIVGGAGNDTLRGGGGGDTVTGGDGNDNIAGNSGADSLVGGVGNDTLAYDSFASGDPASIQGAQVDLLAGTAIDNWGNADSISGFESVVGTSAADTLSGGNGNDSFFGADQHDSISGLAGNDNLSGGFGNDTLDGGPGDDFLRPFDGSDSIIGGPGFDNVGYNGDTGPIAATVTAGTDGQDAIITSALGADTATGIDAIEGTAAGDTFTVTSAASGGIQLRGFAGADTIASALTDRTTLVLADYRVSAATQGAHVDLQAERAFNDGFGSQDVLINIAIVRGTDFGDTLLGTDLNDRFRGRGGNDSMDGRGGTGDVLDYGQAASGIVADLVNGIVQDGEGGADTVANFEDIYATIGADSILGSGASEVFRPFGGADTVDGGGGSSDRLSYIIQTTGLSTPPPAPVGVVVDLVGGTALDPWGDTDIIAGIERVTGTALADSIVGGAEANRFNGRGGDDTLNGGRGGDFAEYGNAASGVAVNLTDGTAQDGEGGADTLISIENVIGSAHADTLTGVSQRGRATSDLRGGAGDDLLTGIAGEYVRADYADQIGGLLISLGAGTAVDGFGNTDTLVNIRGAVMFGDFADTLLGTVNSEWFSPSEGNDSVGAGGGFDIISYAGSDVGGVSVNLVTQRATDTGGGADTIVGIEGVSTSFGDDTIIGGTQNNLFAPGAGADSVDGGLGEDTISYVLGFSADGSQFGANEAGDRLPVQGVLLDLAAGTATDFAGDADTIIGFEHAQGSTAGDTLRGSAIANRIEGAEGNDAIEGREGDDTLAGQWGNDSLDGGSGTNTAVFAGNAADFAIGALAGGRISVTDLRAGAPEGADTLTGIAFLQFADTIVAASTGPTEGADTLNGTAGNDTIDALGGADSVSGLDGADSIVGGAGADTLRGGPGNDSYVVDSAADIVIEASGEGTDIVFADLSWTLANHVDNLTLQGTAGHGGTGNAQANRIAGNGGANSLAGLGGADTLDGGDGADTLEGGDASDRLNGGTGDDLFLVATGDVITDAGGADTVMTANSWIMQAFLETLLLTGADTANANGSNFDNLIVGNGAANRIFGFAGSDTIAGNGGDDFLDGGTGADSIVGGAGNDLLKVDDLADAVGEAAGGGNDTVLATVNWALGDHFETLQLSGAAPLVGTGNALDNRIIGNQGANRLLGGDGADTLDGLVNADTLEGGGGNDTYTINFGADLVVEAPGGGFDTVRSSINHTLAANVEALNLIGTTAINGTGNTENNTINGNSIGNRLRGQDGADTVNGLGGADTVEGGNGNDRLTGGDGNDVLNGGTGNDTMIAGANADIFRYDQSAHGGDSISDFTPGEDLFHIARAGFGNVLAAGALGAGNFASNAPTAAVAQFVYNGATGVLAYDLDGTGAGAAVTIATLTAKPAISAADFLVIA
jgi:Ca2+-binding RTX toxin-like protein